MLNVQESLPKTKVPGRCRQGGTRSGEFRKGEKSRLTLQTRKLPIRQIPLPTRMDHTASMRGDAFRDLVPATGTRGLVARKDVLEVVVGPVARDAGDCGVDCCPWFEVG